MNRPPESHVSRLTALLIAVALVGFPLDAAQEPIDVVIPRGSVWRYFDGAASPGRFWNFLGFNDASWSNGPVLLGYGDSDIVTTIDFGPNSNTKYITSYYRHRFTVSNWTSLTAAAFELLRDDGAIVYLNGTEVFRQNMLAGAVNHNTLSSGSGSDDEYTYLKVFLDPARILDTNVFAVEVHQHKLDTSDSRFNFFFMTRTNTSPLIEDQVTVGTTQTSGVARVTLISTGGLDTDMILYYGSQDGGTDAGAWYADVMLGLQSTGSR
jgi:hypothetical protein